MDAFCELAASILHGFLNAGREYRVCWFDMEKMWGQEKMIRSEEDCREMLKELILCASHVSSRGNDTKSMPGMYQFLRPEETLLSLDMNLQLFLNQELLFRFSEDDYGQELEMGWFSG